MRWSGVAPAFAVSSATARRRRRSPARGCELFEGDVTDAASIAGAGDGIDVAYYLVHAMAGGADFERA